MFTSFDALYMTTNRRAIKRVNPLSGSEEPALKGGRLPLSLLAFHVR